MPCMRVVCFVLKSRYICRRKGIVRAPQGGKTGGRYYVLDDALARVQGAPYLFSRVGVLSFSRGSKGVCCVYPVLTFRDRRWNRYDRNRDAGEGAGAGEEEKKWVYKDVGAEGKINSVFFVQLSFMSVLCFVLSVD